MEKVEVLIIGQGLAGTWLSYWLYKSGISFKIIDQKNPDSASLRAAGLINPVTGRRIVTTWMIDELLPFAINAYRDIGSFLGEVLINETSVIDFFPSVQMLQAFQKRYEEDSTYLLPVKDREKYSEWFRYDLGWGEINPCQLVYVEKLLTSWRAWLKKNNYLVENIFDLLKLKEANKSLDYSGIRASYIIFCDGKSSAQNPHFDKLPFALNKGEAILVEIKSLPANKVYKKGMSLVPFRNNIFWLGSSYEWSFDNDKPSEKFRKNAEEWLNYNLKLSYTILEHFSSIRPATLERRPFVGFHPFHQQIGILNGMGTKGCSLAPYFARQLVDNIKQEGNINPLADINRFGRILTRLT
ncbi:MAG TPA: FAD-dependent oxidoreductase [Puia sp.]|jgi:glycine/D-amino acid oxidase-like deaminating enzyme|nr:FAD-dependent oxidoreductase [Puia sp.]